MNRNKDDPGFPAWLKATITVMIAVAAVTGAGHADNGPAARPTTACVQLQVLSSQVSLQPHRPGRAAPNRPVPGCLALDGPESSLYQ